MATPAPATQWHPELMQRLFARGLGELLILHVYGSDVMLGHLGLKKNRLMLSDAKYLTGVRPGEVAPCLESGFLGMITASSQYEWSSLTFHGLNQCRIKVDLSQTRGTRLETARDLEGEDLMDFVGSVYRGFRLMLNHHFLPVVVLQRLQAKNDEWGFTVVDLRMGAIDLAAIRVVNDAVRRSTERHFEVDMVEENVQDEKFEELFGGFLSHPKPVPHQAAPAEKPAAKAPPVAPPVVVLAEPVPIAQVPMVEVLGAEVPMGDYHHDPADVVQHVLDMLKEVVAEIGAPRAFALFERWVTRVTVEQAEHLKVSEKLSCNTVRDYFEAIAAQMQKAGESHEIVQESGDTILHEIRHCAYREACRRSGVDTEGRWSTCAQAIPSVRSKVAAAVDPRLDWSWTRCDRRAGQPCVFEMKLNART